MFFTCFAKFFVCKIINHLFIYLFFQDKNPSKRETRDTKGDFGLMFDDYEPPHICYNHLSVKDDKSLRMCFVYTHNSASFSVNVSLRPVHEDDQYCNYRLGKLKLSDVSIHLEFFLTFFELQNCFSFLLKNYFNFFLGGNFSCRIPRELEKPNESCKVICDLENAYAPDSVLQQSQCEHIIGDPTFTFWLYLVVSISPPFLSNL